MKNRNEDNAEITTRQVFIKNFYKKVEKSCAIILVKIRATK